jgi:hypothetical protein
MGVDMTSGMIVKARFNAGTRGLENLEFLPGAIERLPLLDASVDLVIFSCILVETHDGLETDGQVLEGISRRLRERFEPTYDIEIIVSRPRSRDELPQACAALSDDEAAEAMDEGRPWAQWLFLQPKPGTRRLARDRGSVAELGRVGSTWASDPSRVLVVTN